MADIGRHVLWERLGADALFAKIIQLLNDGWLSKSIAHSERSSSSFNYGGNLEGDITSKTRPQKGRICTLSRSLAYFEIWGQFLSSKGHIEKLFQAISPNFAIRNWLHC